MRRPSLRTGRADFTHPALRSVSILDLRDQQVYTPIYRRHCNRCIVNRILFNRPLAARAAGRPSLLNHGSVCGTRPSSPAGLAFVGHSRGWLSLVADSGLSPSWVPFAPSALPDFVAHTDPLTPAGRLATASLYPAGLPVSRSLSSNHSVSNHPTSPRSRLHLTCIQRCKLSCPDTFRLSVGMLGQSSGLRTLPAGSP